MDDLGGGIGAFENASLEQYEGCLLGLAMGDALGAPIEFLQLEQILVDYGAEGICGLEPWREFRAGFFTDDTQMSLATARGCIDAYLSLRHGEPWRPTQAVYRRYLAWLRTQDNPFMNRAPGATCLWSLRTGRMGTVKTPLNKRKGCGGVMRVAPAGLAFPPGQAFQYGVEFAAITHGHPSGYLPAGVLADLVARLLEGHSLDICLDATLQELAGWQGHKETLTLLEKARVLAMTEELPRVAIDQLGEGWVGEEALAISVFCAIRFVRDWEGGVLAAVNHSGDSDSTGCITGAILGAALGVDAIPQTWLVQLESTSGIRALADDLYRVVREGVEPRSV